MVSMGTELGGGAMAWLQQQMWPVQGWRGGRRCAWQRGPAWDVAGLRLEQACGSGGPPPPGSSLDSQGPRASTGCTRLPFCPPSSWAQPQAQQDLSRIWDSLRAPVFAE